MHPSPLVTAGPGIVCTVASTVTIQVVSLLMAWLLCTTKITPLDSLGYYIAKEIRTAVQLTHLKDEHTIKSSLMSTPVARTKSIVIAMIALHTYIQRLVYTHLTDTLHIILPNRYRITPPIRPWAYTRNSPKLRFSKTPKLSMYKPRALYAKGLIPGYKPPPPISAYRTVNKASISL